MKLMFDQNLSPRLVSSLVDLYPDSNHVFNLGLNQAHDKEIREFAFQNEFTIVTKDSDFGDLNILLGFPPKVIWIRRGNCSAREIESILRDEFDSISAHHSNSQSGLLILV